MSISERKTLDYLFKQTLFAIIKWPLSRTTRHGLAFPFSADKWQELIELQWNVYSVGAHALSENALVKYTVAAFNAAVDAVIIGAAVANCVTLLAFDVRFPLEFLLIHILIRCKDRL